MESLLDKIYTIRVERFTRHDYTTSNTMIHDVLHHSAVECLILIGQKVLMNGLEQQRITPSLDNFFKSVRRHLFNIFGKSLHCHAL